MPHNQLAFHWDDDAPPPEDSGPSPQPPVTPVLTPLPQIAPLAARLKKLAGRGIYLGTASWKYPGWVGQVYDPERYAGGSKDSGKDSRESGCEKGFSHQVSEARFNRECLAEYAVVFPTVGGDFSFYQFPSPSMWREMFEQVPDGFRFSLKVPEDVTVQRWPDLPRYGKRAGEENPHFMDAALVGEKLLLPLEPYRDRLGVLIFEFGTIHRPPLSRPAEFAAALDRFLAALPLDRFKFAVEVRNREYLQESGDYLACLKAHGVAHCLNSWTRMPPLSEQLRIPGIFTADHVAARLLLRPGRAYQQAVDRFAPYDRIQEPYPDGRSALHDLIERCLTGRQALFAFVNNRFEGNAPQTIEESTRDFD